MNRYIIQLVTLIFIPALLALSACSGSLGEDLDTAIQASDCNPVTTAPFNIVDGLTAEWAAIDPDTISDPNGDYSDPNLDIIYADFVYDTATFALKYQIALAGVPTIGFGYLIQVNDHTLVIEDSGGWAAQLFAPDLSVLPEIVTATAFGFEGEILNMGIGTSMLLQIHVAARDGTTIERDKTSRVCLSIP